MLSIATIPMARGSFTGCICAVCYKGREYRLATYRGARAKYWSGDGAVIGQGKYRLEIKLLEGQSHPLRAPLQGSMGRIIHESLCSKLHFCFRYENDTIFEHTDCCASFEYSDENSI